MSVIAVDCDLRKVYAVAAGGHVICKAAPSIAPLLAPAWAAYTILFEVASALDYSDSKAIAHQKRRWTIWNIATAARLAAAHPKVLVSPSHLWTRGHQLKVRHAFAKCVLGQKDLRECESMIFMYHHRPQDWVPFQEFLDAI